MEAGDRARAGDLNRLDPLRKDPGRVHLFQALRLIEAAYPQNPRLGQSQRPREDAVRLGQDPHLAFPASTVSRFDMPAGGKPGRLQNRAFGMFGPQGPLPLHLTEYARDRLRNHRDPTFAAFADMLTHRLMSLFYRAWAEAEPAPSFDRAGEEDRFARHISALSGHMGQGFEDRDAMPDLAKRHFAGLLSMGTRSAEGLKAIVSAFFNAPVTVQQFVGDWLELEPSDRWQMGQPGGGLGQTTSLGSKVWSRSAKFRLRIGPLPLADFQRLLPGGSSLARLDAAVRNYVGDVLDYDVNLVLAAAEVPAAQLGASTRLGHTSWIGTRGSDRDADDLYIIPRSARGLGREAVREGQTP